VFLIIRHTRRVTTSDSHGLLWIPHQHLNYRRRSSRYRLNWGNAYTRSWQPTTCEILWRRLPSTKTPWRKRIASITSSRRLPETIQCQYACSTGYGKFHHLQLLWLSAYQRHTATFYSLRKLLCTIPRELAWKIVHVYLPRLRVQEQGFLHTSVVGNLSCINQRIQEFPQRTEEPNVGNSVAFDIS
jgi:hypothetical protein